jgi:predicted nucleotide-binding protein
VTYYHVHITTRPETAKGNPVEALELDLPYDDLMSKIVLPFLGGRTFFCGGVIVDPKKVREVHISETSQPSEDLIPFIRAERRSSGIISFRSDAEYVPGKGKDVTRTVLDAGEAMLKPVASNRDDLFVAGAVGQNADEKAELSNSVFVVHGHDIVALDQTELLLRRWGLEPIILREQPSEGMTVIEKIEANTEVGFAIVIFSPDDVGGIDNDHLAPRARQNVVFECGYLMAKLGRRRVVCLQKHDTEIPSDLHGIVRIDVAGDLKDAIVPLRRELLAAGYKLEEM